MSQPPPTTPPRQGPRPLPLHLLMQASMLLSSLPALPASKIGSLPWKPHLQPQAAALAAELAQSDDRAVVDAVNAEICRRLDGFLTGITDYRHHPARRDLPDPPALWQDGASRLLDFGAGGPGPVVLLVPSLINRAYVLDLSEKRSFARYLAARGFRPLMVDWGCPGEAERGLDLTGYVGGRLTAALAVAAQANGGRPLPVVGYCMGGLLALALATLNPTQISALALLATPWDFHADGTRQASLIRAMRPMLETIVERADGLPVDVLQAMFSTIDPFGAGKKFRHFAALNQRTAKAREFVAIEDWANDGVPLVAAVARECLFGWYGDNLPVRGQWQVAGQPVRPEVVDQPCLVMVPSRDRIVPPASAMALAERLPKAVTKILSAGHVGMMTGRRAKTDVYAPLSKWLGRFA